MPCEQEGLSAMPQNIWGAKRQEAYFRKAFLLEEELEKAILRIYVDTGYSLYLNGRFVAAADEWGNTRDYEVAGFLLPGGNVIAVKGINHGGHRGLALELRTVARNGDVVSVVSDSTWRSAPEARWGWKSLGFDDSGWGKARPLPLAQVGAAQWKGRPGDDLAKIVHPLECSPFLLGAIPKLVDSPFFTAGKPVRKTTPEVFDIIGEEYQANLDNFPPDVMFPARVVEADPGNGTLENAGGMLGKGSSSVRISAARPCGGPSLIVDFGCETVGYLRVKTVSESDVCFKLVFAETLGECHHLPPKESLFRKMVTEEVHLASGEQEWECDNRQGFRFVKIEFVDCQEPVELAGVSVRTSLYPVPYQGYFSCSDPLLNGIWEAGRRTLHLCMQEYYLDGIKRDRFLWVGDARLEALINYYAFGDQALFEFSWKKMAGVQHRDGGIPSVLGEGASIIWDYVAWWIIAFGDFNRHIGDLEFPKAMKAHIVKAMEWLVAKSGADGLIDVPENRTEGWMVVLNKNSGKDLSMNFLFCRSLRVASEILGALGDTSAASRYEELALKAEWAFDGLTGGSGVKGFSPELKCAASGSLDAFEAIESFFRNGKAEEGLRFIRENWGPMLDAGGGTFWEAPSSRPDHRVDVPADRFISESHCHGWTAGPTCALLSEVAGIKPTVPGFRSFEVKPLLGGLAFVKGVVPTPFGPIAVSLKKDGDGVEMVILVPEGCQAMVSLPSADGGHGAVEIKQAGMHTIRRR